MMLISRVLASRIILLGLLSTINKSKYHFSTLQISKILIIQAAFISILNHSIIMKHTLTITVIMDWFLLVNLKNRYQHLSTINLISKKTIIIY